MLINGTHMTCENQQLIKNLYISTAYTDSAPKSSDERKIKNHSILQFVTTPVIILLD